MSPNKKKAVEEECPDKDVREIVIRVQPSKGPREERTWAVQVGPLSWRLFLRDIFGNGALYVLYHLRTGANEYSNKAAAIAAARVYVETANKLGRSAKTRYVLHESIA